MHLKTLGDLLKSAGYTPKDGVAAGQIEKIEIHSCLLYTSDAADEL
mgnify:CR=1 FL=1